jgi:hypothetical protein
MSKNNLKSDKICNEFNKANKKQNDVVCGISDKAGSVLDKYHAEALDAWGNESEHGVVLLINGMKYITIGKHETLLTGKTKPAKLYRINNE